VEEHEEKDDDNETRQRRKRENNPKNRFDNHPQTSSSTETGGTMLARTCCSTILFKNIRCLRSFVIHSEKKGRVIGCLYSANLREDSAYIHESENPLLFRWATLATLAQHGPVSPGKGRKSIAAHQEERAWEYNVKKNGTFLTPRAQRVHST
jgi:hypothetical protein